MNLTTEQVKNLNILADFMDGLNTTKFTMDRYVSYEKPGCYSPACALGWACTVPALKAAGMDMQVLEEARSGEPSRMAKRVFGEYSEIFDSSLSRKIYTPQQWAAHCRAFLKVNGYATTDHFRTFMNRVLIPVDIKETTTAKARS